MPEAANTIGPDGGTITAADGAIAGASITVPPGALVDEQPIRISVGELRRHDGHEAAGPVVDLSPAGLRFAKPVIIRVPWDPDSAPEGLTEDHLVAVHRHDGGGVNFLGIRAIDHDPPLVTVRVESFSEVYVLWQLANAGGVLGDQTAAPTDSITDEPTDGATGPVEDPTEPVPEPEPEPTVAPPPAPEPGTATLRLFSASDTGVSSTDRITADNTPTLIGEVEGNVVADSVELFANDEPAGSAQVASDGSLAATIGPLPDGVVKVTSQLFADGVAGPRSDALEIFIDTTAPPRPGVLDLLTASDTGRSSADNVTNSTAPQLRANAGGAHPGATAHLFDNGSQVRTATVDSAGNVAFTPTGRSSGTHVFGFSVTDAAGNESQGSPSLTVTIDTTAPGKPTIDMAASSDTGVSNTDNVTSDRTPELTGGAEPGATVLLQSGSTDRGDGTAASNGTWTVDSDPLPDGVIPLQAVAEDLAGNQSPPSTTLNVTIDTIAPTTPTIDLVASSDSGRSSTDNVTNDTTPSLSGTADSGAIVLVSGLPGGTVERTANGAGTWQLQSDALADGQYSLFARVQDLAGNNAQSSLLVVRVDTVAPATPDAPELQGGSTSDTTPTFTGKAGAVEGGGRVILREGATVLGTTIANTNGSWSITSSELAPGEHTVHVVVEDLAGNTSASSPTTTFTITS